MRLILLISLLIGSAAVGFIEPSLPVWDATERTEMIKEGWVAGDWFLTLISEEEEKGVEKRDTLPSELENPTPNELAVSPEHEEEVSAKYLDSYFAEEPEGYLIDVQKLLTIPERKNLEALLDYHAGDSSIPIYLYIFGGEQYIPSDVREEELVERLFPEGRTVAVVNYYVGAPQRSALHLSPAITDAVSISEQRRALESAVMQALAKTKPFDQIETFLTQMSIRMYWMERMTKGTAVETLETIPNAKKDRDGQKEKSLTETMGKLPPWVKSAGIACAASLGGFLLLWIALIWWRRRTHYRFPEFEAEPRLGGNHAAGIGAVISFSSSSIPPATQRTQVAERARRG